MTDNRPPLWVSISMLELRKLWTLVRIRIREVFEETLGVRSQAEGRIIGLNVNDWRQRVSGCGHISAQSLNCILLLQKIYILSTTDQASLHDFGDYNLHGATNRITSTILLWCRVLRVCVLLCMWVMVAAACVAWHKMGRPFVQSRNVGIMLFIKWMVNHAVMMLIMNGVVLLCCYLDCPLWLSGSGG
jgi:hypothetical protein